MGKKNKDNKPKEKQNNRTITVNKKARFNYEILERYEAGIVLMGTEVKSIRDGNVNLNDTYGRFIKGELYAVNMHISHYKQGNRFNHDVTRSRKLLLHKKELKKLLGKTTEKGLTIIPLKLYFKEGLVKVELGLCKGKKEFEKNQSQKRRDENIKMQRIIKQMKN